MKYKLQKKHKYLFYSFIVSAFIFSFTYVLGFWKIVWVAAILALGVVGVLIIQKQSLTKNNLMPVLLLPLHLIAGALLSLVYFPNLGFVIRAGAIMAVGLILYAVCLVDNIFLVTDERQKTFPLYRAASTWAYVLLVIIAIPYFAGVYKIPVSTYFQNLVVGFSSALFLLYLFWVQDFDADVKEVGVGERIRMSMLVLFIVLSLGVSVSFVPTESFLRALFISSVLMFSLGYIQAHYKNVITRKLILEYTLISLIFFITMLVFTP